MATSSGSNGTKSEHFVDPALNRMQASVQTMTQQSRTCPLVQGVALTSFPKGTTGVALTTSPTNVPHGLGRAFVGYLVTAMYGGTPFGVCLAGQQTDPTKYVTLVASNPGNVNLWVF